MKYCFMFLDYLINFCHNCCTHVLDKWQGCVRKSWIATRTDKYSPRPYEENYPNIDDNFFTGYYTPSTTAIPVGSQKEREASRKAESLSLWRILSIEVPSISLQNSVFKFWPVIHVTLKGDLLAIVTFLLYLS